MMRQARHSVAILTLITICLLASSAGAHRFHVSIAEAEFNDSSQCLEIALNVSVHDMQEALRQHDEWAGSAKDESELQQRLSTYVNERWRFLSADGLVRTPLWIGHQVEGEHLWLYFEIIMPGGLEGARIDNRIFFELDPRQVNTVNFRQGDWRFSIAYSQSQRVRTISREDG